MGHATFNAGDLTAVIGDNAADGVHRAGYNGIWDLRHAKSRKDSRSLFVPSYAGLNHEHIFGGENDRDRDVFFEPRVAPMTFKSISDSEAELHQPPTPTFHLESWTRFKLVAPHYIDMTYKCRPAQHVFDRGYIGLFWASYINAPLDKSMYFYGGPEGTSPPLWQQLCTQAHNRDSTIRHRKDDIKVTFAEETRPSLFKSLSPLRFDLPFFYGNFENLTFLVMFSRPDGIRMTHSPSGGGADADRKTTCPAWDFQFIIPKYEVLKEYGFNARIVLRPTCSRDEIMKEFQSWTAEK